jgi:uncharacterized protein (DUF1800 family)
MADTTLPPLLDRVDPTDAWQAWKPDSKDAWGPKWIGHLYRRAAFGATPAEVRAATQRGHAATMKLILDGAPTARGLDKTMEDSGELVAKRNNNIYELRAWWIWCMLHSAHPLNEKMTLFWHNHFVSSQDKVQRTVLMFTQNKLLRRHAMARLRPFVLEVSKDPAMLIYLDSNSNVKGAPNENYARELMELFTLGVGNYTEKDIREAARAFTGWHTDGDEFSFEKSLHDDGVKTVLGKTGKLDGGDVVDACLAREDCAHFIVGKLYRNFISESPEPPVALLKPLAERFRKSDYDIADVVRTMLSSRLFFSAHAFRRRIKSPVEFVVGAARSTAGPLQPDDPPMIVPQAALVRQLEAMGQNLFAPPNVKGWRGGQSWLNTSTVLARQNFGQTLAMGNVWQGNIPRGGEIEFDVPPEVVDPLNPNPKQPNLPEEPPPPKEFDPARLVHAAKAEKAEDVVRVLIDVYLPGGVGQQATARLVEFVKRGNPAKGTALDRRIRETVHAIVSMPEYQLA